MKQPYNTAKQSLNWLFSAIIFLLGVTNIFGQSCTPPPSGIVSWWAGESNTLDQVGTNNGTWGGTPGYGLGEVGTAFELNGENCVRVPDSSSLHFTNMTAETWIYPTGYGSGILVKWDAVPVGQSAFSFAVNNGGEIYLLLNLANSGSAQATSTNTVPLNHWSHVAGTYDGNTIKVYINGVLAASTAASGTISAGTDALAIGAVIGGSSGQTAGFNGLIDEPSLYNRALMASEIAAIYNAGAGGKCSAASFPKVTSQPQNQTVYAGTNVTFSVAASGSAPLFYQWSDTNGIIAGQTNFLLTVSNVQSSDSYFVTVSNSLGSIASSNALLTVLVPAMPAISVQPLSQTVYAGTNVVLTVTATGTLPLNYQWEFNNTPIAGAISSNLSLINVQPSNAGNYSVIVSNYFGATSSSNAVLTVITPPCTPPSSNIVSWWAGESNTLDQAGGNNGTWGGAPGYGQGKVGTAFNLNGENCVRVPDSSSLHFTNMTAETWINPSGYYDGILVKWDAVQGVNQSSFSFALDSGGHLYLLLNLSNQSSVSAVSTNSVPLNQWSHVAGTYDGSTIKVYINGALAGSTAAIGSIFVGTDALGIGAVIGGTSGQTAGFTGLIDEPALYNSALSASDIAAIYNAGAGGKCPGTILPSITSQPQSQTVGSGSNVTFTVGAGGSIPLSYQWIKNSNAIPNATNAWLTLSNVTVALNGATFSVAVSNQAGSILSSNAVLNVLPPPSVLLIPNQTATSGIVVVPVTLLAQGNENTVGFSINFDTNFLSFASAQLDADDQNIALLVNTNQLPNGHVGLGISQPVGDAFEAGTNVVADVTFIVLPKTNANTTQITFGDTPIPRQDYDASADSLATLYTNGTLTIPYLGFEGDVYPLSNGDAKVLLNDWVEMGRIVAGLDIVTNAGEFQRADCAPRSTLGDGNLTVSDWIQVGRYAAGLDPLTVAGGPTQAASSGNSSIAIPSSSGGSSPRPMVSATSLSVMSANVAAGQNCQLSVVLAAQGGESGVEFSIAFPSNVLSYVSAALGSNDTGASLILNTNQIPIGRLGVVLALPAGSSFTSGNQEVLKLTLKAAAISAGNNVVAFYSQPLPDEVSDVTANPVSSSYLPGAVTVAAVGRPALSVNGKSFGPGFSFTYPASAGGFILESTSGLNPPHWTNAAATLVTNGNNIIVTGATNTTQIYYRLRSP